MSILLWIFSITLRILEIFNFFINRHNRCDDLGEYFCVKTLGQFLPMY